MFISIIIVFSVSSSCNKNSESSTNQEQNGSGDNAERDSSTTLTLDNCKKCMVLSEQTTPAVYIVDVGRAGMVMWSWTPLNADISGNQKDWFSHIDEAKPVYDNKYILTTSSSKGGVALVRIKDKKVMFYANPGSNVHSAELLPDGNIVVALSTPASKLVVYHVDTTQALNNGFESEVELPYGHNIVWDKKRQVLWSFGQKKLYKFDYNFNCKTPELTLVNLYPFNQGTNPHDMFPVDGEDALWLTVSNKIYKIVLDNTIKFSEVDAVYHAGIKSISSGPKGWGWPTIIQKPTESYWADQIIDLDGNIIFKHIGWKIYKARWFVPNLFSYPNNDNMKVCSG